MRFDGVSADAKANVYFGGKVVSHTIRLGDGSRKTLGLVFPGEFHFGTEQAERMEWTSNLKASVVSAAVLPVGTMTTLELWRYSRHLSRQDQAFALHAIAFWKKALYPMACFVMLGLALPFAYLHARGGGISLKVFGGIMIGISFMVFNNLSSHLGLLQGWSPLLAAAAPGLFYLMMSLAAFAWLVRYR